MVNRKRLDPTESAAALFGAKLRKFRDKAGLSQAKLAETVGYSHDTISKVETAAQAPSPQLAELLDAHFGTDETFQELQPLAAKEGIPVFFRPYAELESTANAVRVYDHLVVSGLLQTEDYAREVLRPGQLAHDLDRAVASRMARQDVLARKDPPWVVVLLMESAIRNVVGTRDITKDQLNRLLELRQEPNISILIAPLNSPVYPASGFTLLSSKDNADLAYVEGAGGNGHVIELSSRVEQIRRLWDMISNVALTDTASEALIREVMEGL
ncbi:helix-turn-helix domain-containing protein [Actinomadura latina]|uniref:Helix-turn-helix domain-containing protein n=1 Tax=Actinomadura latina TaxID=163603 RepID=A0A846Z7M6_9ACTN|nr:helix-turn-helix transcriptional regulator [Actinomadura latina]NKZ06605.1 helix-turn-helix domain-containing protein [Actinomadura latina]